MRILKGERVFLLPIGYPKGSGVSSNCQEGNIVIPSGMFAAIPSARRGAVFSASLFSFYFSAITAPALSEAKEYFAI
jgi:hypothetical protein